MIDYWRQLDFVTPADFTFEISLIGAGGLGSPIALALVKMGCPRISVFDADRVEPHNLPNQLYRLDDIGSAKVDALARLLREFAPAEVSTFEEMVAERSFTGIVISAVDSMAARQEIWQRCIRYNAKVPMYLDARMGGEVGRLLTVSPTNPLSIEAYEATLFADEDGMDDPCTAQSTIYATFGIAALVGNQVKRYVRGEPLMRDHILDFSTSMLLADDPA
jgi:molybdopterin/thiamine biosynthesis adenylyltransferase